MSKFLISFLFTLLCFANPLSAQIVFEEKPKDFNPKMDVTACFIRVDDQILFLKRLPSKPQGNTWGIPGGKSEKGETAEDTTIREIREETGIQIPKDSMSYFGKFYVRYPDMDYTFHIFEYETDQLPQIQYNPEEHAGYRWVTLEEAFQMPLMPGEEECIAYVYTSVNPSKHETVG